MRRPGGDFWFNGVAALCRSAKGKMELFLNILWLLMVCGGVAVWRTRWTQQSRIRRHAKWREWTAFVCAMVLLFFVVSLTDDLHAELMLIEECSSSRRHASCLTCAHHPSPSERDNATPGSAILPAGPAMQSFVFISSITSYCENSQLRLHGNLSSGRAPPAAAL
ncbi:MAG: hypothetical protein WBY24_12910 [Candidatus Acidiferrales bacterium]